MPSTEDNNFLSEKIIVEYRNTKVDIRLHDTPLTKRFVAEALVVVPVKVIVEL